MAFLCIRTEFMDESDWIAVWHFWASEQNSWTSRTGFLYGLSGHPNRIHGRVVLDFCMAFLGIRTEFMDESYWISVWPFCASQATGAGLKYMQTSRLPGSGKSHPFHTSLSHPGGEVCMYFGSAMKCHKASN